MRQTLKAVLLFLLLSALAAGRQSTNDAKGSAPSQNEPISGKQLYVSYCSMCHGTDAKGGGPFSPQLKVWPPDLTQLARKNNGTYPAMRVSEMIDGEFGKGSAHGAREMPIWGPVFRSMAHGHNDSAQLRINNVVKYVELLQQK
jgi:mono/diheme cytochrome c family protein